MHILFLSKWYPGRNDPQLGVFIREQARAVARLEQVTVLFAHPVKGLDEKFVLDRQEAEGLLEFKAYYRDFDHPFWLVRKLFNFGSYLKAMDQAWKASVKERGRPDLAHVHILVRPAIWALYLKIRFRIPFIISEQSSEYLDGTWQQKNVLFKTFNRWLVGKAASLTAVSTHLRDGMLACGLKGHYEVVPNVLPTDRLALAPHGNAHHLLMVADLVDKTKNISGIMRAVHALRADHPEIRLDVIGGGRDGTMLHNLSKDLGLEEQVRFLGRMPNQDVLKHMAVVGVVVINSRVETFSVVTGEALMLGKPVIATRCGGPEAFVTPKNGLLIAVDDDQELIDAIRTMFSLHAELDPATIRSTIQERTSAEAVGTKFISIYDQVLKA